MIEEEKLETDKTADSSAEQNKTKWWQFSLREIVIGTAAIAAFIAVAIQNQPRETSSLGQKFNPTMMVEQVVKQKSLKGQVYGLGGGGAMVSSSQIRNSSRTEIDGLSALELESVLMPALLAEIKAAITDEGYAIIGGGKAGNTGEVERISDFRLAYEGDKIQGLVRVFAEFKRKKNSILIVTLDEN